MTQRTPTYFSWLPKPFYKLDFLGIFEKDPFGNSLFVKRLFISIAASFLYNRMTVINKLKVEGMEHLEGLPENDVLFLSNHQTYFADAMALVHILSAAKWGLKNTIVPPIYLLAPRTRLYYVAATETMKAGILPRLFSLAGAITVDRSWRAEGQDVKRSLDTSAGDRIAIALAHGWVISFPQGTTKPYVPVRKGTGHLIKDSNPIVVPVVINGFRRAFDKKGLRYRIFNTTLSVKFKEPRRFSADMTVEQIVAEVQTLIEQNVPERLK
jgi:1-acyl-sn-glycerol-3-phosphate acyltransferase